MKEQLAALHILYRDMPRLTELLRRQHTSWMRRVIGGSSRFEFSAAFQPAPRRKMKEHTPPTLADSYIILVSGEGLEEHLDSRDRERLARTGGFIFAELSFERKPNDRLRPVCRCYFKELTPSFFEEEIRRIVRSQGLGRQVQFFYPEVYESPHTGPPVLV